MVREYPRADLPLDADYLLADFYYLEGDFASGYAALGNLVDQSTHLSLAPYLGHPRLTYAQVMRWSEGSITTKGIRHYGAIMEALQTRLDDFHAQHGMSLLEDFWYRLTADKTVEEVAADIEDEVVQRLSGDTVRYLLAESRDADRPVETPGAFEGWSGYEEPIVWPGPWVRHLDHNALVFWRLRALVRAAENDVRDQVKIPRIGEGLVSEMKLLREIQAAFPGERIVHQARPGWLVPQSLDIYFSDYNIGIEYQGAQHTRPVEFFGGADAFERQQDRDLIKASLCGEYGCALIEVHPGYDLEAVLSQVKDAITAARSKATEHS